MPKGQYQRIRKVAAAPSIPPVEVFREAARILDSEEAPELVLDEPAVPAHWSPGALLNVRCTGGDYIITLYPEEYDARSPERAMRFANPALAQNFVSQWYSRKSNDPRAW